MQMENTTENGMAVMREKRALTITKVVLAVFWTGIILFVLKSSVSEHPLRSSRAVQRNLIAITPQGWSFFTRNPREAVDRIYRRVDNEWIHATVANSSARNFFGLKRDARALSVELASLLTGIPHEKWQACRSSLTEYLEMETIKSVPVENRSLMQSLCGDILVQRRPPVPWAWSKRMKRIHMPSRIVRLDVRCGLEDEST